MLRFLFIVPCLALFSCGGKMEPDSISIASLSDTPEGAGIETLLKTYYRDMSDRDWEAYRSHFWDNATITTAWQQPGDSTSLVDITVIDDFILETPNGPDSQPIFEESMKDSKITVNGNLAEAWVTYQAKFGTPDSLMQWTGTDVFTLLRHEGEWKIVSLVFESDN